MSLELKLDEGLCRCCHAQGMFQNLSTPFVCQGQEEIYLEMLKECFNVVITPLEGEYSTSTYTICITCALKLRDANEFKKQILECEERFKEVCKEVMKSLEPMDLDIKLEIDITGDQSIKEEPSYDDMDTGAEESYDVKSEESKGDSDATLKKTQTDDNKGKGRKLRVASNKVKPAVKVNSRIGVPRRRKRSSNNSTINETDSTKNKAATVTGTRKKIIDKKTLDKSYKKDEKESPTITEPETPMLMELLLKGGDAMKQKYNMKMQVPPEIPESVVPEIATVKVEDIKPGDEKKSTARTTRKVSDLHKEIFTVQDSTTPEFMCIKCGKIFDNKDSCLAHLKKIHHTLKRYKCPVCDRTFGENKSKSLHLAKVHGKQEHVTMKGRTLKDLPLKFQCDICDSKFFSKSTIRHHIGNHMKKRCSRCGVSCKSERDTCNHMVEVHGLEVPTCGICGMRSLRNCVILRHQRKVHMKERDYECEVCKRKFFTSFDLKKHMISHNPERNHECPYCHKKYSRPKTLRQHVKIHTGQKDKVCSLCGVRFVQKASLNYHMVKYHPEVN